MEMGGVEPPTCALRTHRSDHLSYIPICAQNSITQRTTSTTKINGARSLDYGRRALPRPHCASPVSTAARRSPEPQRHQDTDRRQVRDASCLCGDQSSCLSAHSAFSAASSPRDRRLTMASRASWRLGVFARKHRIATTRGRPAQSSGKPTGTPRFARFPPALIPHSILGVFFIAKIPHNCYNPVKKRPKPMTIAAARSKMPPLNTFSSPFRNLFAQDSLVMSSRPRIPHRFHRNTWAFSKRQTSFLSSSLLVPYLRHLQPQKARKGPDFRLSDYFFRNRKCPFAGVIPCDPQPPTRHENGLSDARSKAKASRRRSNVPLWQAAIGGTVRMAKGVSRRSGT
jgi:hypothetical protein